MSLLLKKKIKEIQAKSLWRKLSICHDIVFISTFRNCEALLYWVVLQKTWELFFLIIGDDKPPSFRGARGKAKRWDIRAIREMVRTRVKQEKSNLKILYCGLVYACEKNDLIEIRKRGSITCFQKFHFPRKLSVFGHLLMCNFKNNFGWFDNAKPQNSCTWILIG